MKEEELRIGNYIYIPGLFQESNTIGVIENISKKEVKTDKCDANISMFRPIPLTKVLIENYGFVFIDNNNKYGWYLIISKNRALSWCYSKEISLEFDTEDYDYNNTLYDFNCEYLHQLQNLYFVLTGEELTPQD